MSLPGPLLKKCSGRDLKRGMVDTATEEMTSEMLPVDATNCPSSVIICHPQNGTERIPTKRQSTVVKVGSISIPIYATSSNRADGTMRTLHCVAFHDGDRRVRRNFASFDEAKSFAEKQARAIGRGEWEAGRVTGDDARTLITAKTLIRETGLSVVEVCHQFVAATKRLHAGVTLLQAVEDFAARVSTLERDMPIRLTHPAATGSSSA